MAGKRNPYGFTFFPLKHTRLNGNKPLPLHPNPLTDSQILESFAVLDIAISSLNMPTIAANDLAAFAAGDELKCGIAVKSGRSGETRSNGCASPRKRKLGNESAVEDNQLPTTPPPELRTPRKWKSPRRCMDGSPISPPFVCYNVSISFYLLELQSEIMLGLDICGGISVFDVSLIIQAI